MFSVLISFKISSNSYSLHKQKLFGFLIIFKDEEVLRWKCKIISSKFWCFVSLSHRYILMSYIHGGKDFLLKGHDALLTISLGFIHNVGMLC